MISYFKYTDGNAFTLNGQDYRGMVNVIDNTAFTGSVRDSTSKILSSKNTFYSNFLLNKQNYIDPPTTSISSEISAVNVYPRSILTINSLTEILNTLNLNNIKLFKAGMRYNPVYFNLGYRDANTLPATYCLSAETSTPKVERLPVHNVDLARAGNSRLTSLLSEQQSYGSLFITLSDTFKYYNNYVVATGFTNAVSSVSIDPGLEGADFYHKFLSYDRYNNLIYQTDETSYTIYTYNYNSPNNNLLVVDRIDLTAQSTTTNNNNSTYGRNYRSVIVSDQGIPNIEIYSLKDSQLQKAFTPESLKLTSIVKIAQRFEDDILVVLGIRDEELILQTYDIIDILLNNINPIELSLLSFDLQESEALPTSIELSNFDSDLIIFKYNQNNVIQSIQFRSLTSSVAPLATYTVNNFSIANIKINSVLEQVNTPLGQGTGIVMGDDTPKILDIKFYPAEYLNSVIVSNNFIRTDTYPIIESIVPGSLRQNYSTLTTTGNNSIGLTINSLVKAIIQDTISLYYYFTEKYSPRIILNGDVGTIGVNLPTFITNIKVDDFYIYGNESINSSTLNRMLMKVYEIQYTLANTIALNNAASQ